MRFFEIQRRIARFSDRKTSQILSKMSHLNTGRLNLSTLRDLSRAELFTLLDAIDGSKAMVWDNQLITPFGLISDYKLLKEHGVGQMLELRSGGLPTVNAQNLIYFIRPRLAFIDIIAGKQIMEF